MSVIYLSYESLIGLNLLISYIFDFPQKHELIVLLFYKGINIKMNIL